MARPKKDVILYCEDAALLSRLAFTVATRCVFARVTTVQTPLELRQAIAEAHNLGCGVLVLSTLSQVAQEAVEEFLRITRGLPVMQVVGGPLLWTRSLVIPDGLRMDCMGQVLERIRLLCARKRGPKKRGAQERAA